MSRTIFFLVLMFVLTASAVNVYLVLHNSEWSDRTYTLWNMTVSILIAFWAVKDQGSKNAKYLDLGYLYFFAWPIVLPIYLARSRGIEQGVTMFLGFVLLAFLPWLSGLIAYVYFT